MRSKKADSPVCIPEPGLYTSWAEAAAQVDGFKGAEHRSFRSLEEAQAWLGMGYSPTPPLPRGTQPAPRIGPVAALRWAREHGHPGPVYTDSQVALAWLRQGPGKTSCTQPLLRERLEEARRWVAENSVPIPVYRWIKDWGENPADYGRK